MWKKEIRWIKFSVILTDRSVQNLSNTKGYFIRRTLGANQNSKSSWKCCHKFSESWKWQHIPVTKLCIMGGNQDVHLWWRFKHMTSAEMKIILFSFPSVSVPVRHLAALSPLRVSQMMWFSLHATTLSCIILSTPWRGGPSSSALMWTTASRRSPWTEWALPTGSTMSCLLEQVKGWFLLPTLSRQIEKEADGL